MISPHLGWVKSLLQACQAARFPNSALHASLLVTSVFFHESRNHTGAFTIPTPLLSPSGHLDDQEDVRRGVGHGEDGRAGQGGDGGVGAVGPQ